MRAVRQMYESSNNNQQFRTFTNNYRNCHVLLEKTRRTGSPARQICHVRCQHSTYSVLGPTGRAVVILMFLGDSNIGFNIHPSYIDFDAVECQCRDRRYDRSYCCQEPDAPQRGLIDLLRSQNHSMTLLRLKLTTRRGLPPKQKKLHSAQHTPPISAHAPHTQSARSQRPKYARSTAQRSA